MDNKLMIEITKAQAVLIINIIDSDSKGEYYNIPAADALREHLISGIKNENI